MTRPRFHCRTGEQQREELVAAPQFVDAVWFDDGNVVDMFGAVDIDSLQFETRCLLRRLRALTGETEDTAIHRALAERYQRLTGPATLAERRQELLRSLESVWRLAPDGQLGRGMSRPEEDAILGHGPEGA